MTDRILNGLYTSGKFISEGSMAVDQELAEVYSVLKSEKMVVRRDFGPVWAGLLEVIFDTPLAKITTQNLHALLSMGDKFHQEDLFVCCLLDNCRPCAESRRLLGGAYYRMGYYANAMSCYRDSYRQHTEPPIRKIHMDPNHTRYTSAISCIIQIAKCEGAIGLNGAALMSMRNAIGMAMKIGITSGTIYDELQETWSSLEDITWGSNFPL